MFKWKAMQKRGRKEADIATRYWLRHSTMLHLAFIETMWEKEGWRWNRDRCPIKVHIERFAICWLPITFCNGSILMRRNSLEKHDRKPILVPLLLMASFDFQFCNKLHWGFEPPTRWHEQWTWTGHCAFNVYCVLCTRSYRIQQKQIFFK